MAFRGIPSDAFRYFQQLERHNDKEWWHAHRELWDDGVLGPLRALAEELAPEFGDLDVTRPNRDIRLTKDKRPYQQFAAITRAGADAGGLYLEIDAHSILVAAGYWAPSSEQLKRFRAVVDDDQKAEELQRVLGDLRRHRLPLGEPAALATAPRGYSRDHPRIELLRRTRLTVERRWPEAAWMNRGSESRRRIRDAWRAASAWNDWLEENVGGGSVERRATDDL